MTSPVDGLLETLIALRSAWGEAVPAGDERAMTDAALLDVNERLAAARRLLDALHARVAAEMALRSRPEQGKDGLARQAGFRTPAKLIAAATGGHPADAARLIQVGEATRERTLLTGEAAPSRHPHVAHALRIGRISVPAAAAITSLLDRIELRVEEEKRDSAERSLVVHATQLSLEELQAVLRRAEAVLDPDGLEPAVAALHAERFAKIVVEPSGAILLTARLDPESAAPVVAVLDGIVTHQLRASRGRNTPDGVSVDRAGAAMPENRTLPQMRADALAAICRHAIGCDTDRLPGSAATVVVRMNLSDLETGTGIATIDGMEQPLDAGSARRIAAASGIIPAVLGTRSEVLDLGRTARHFTRAQRLALVERDGGCAGCHLPPGYTEAHHLRWWTRDAGRTDLVEGILLCTACHHRVHEEGWEIRIDAPPGGSPLAGTVWFVPPPHIDPARTPRPGGRKRYDPLTWDLLGEGTALSDVATAR
ncbi:DUF222 domain-containing protein [Microbacterium sp. RD1]|uniref:HNH endonuclease n=1 Tax=Microbacterium sp. RD1 TaxID=3457313 RepID=UPI003FA5509F